jgi:hypothetical protein
MPIYLRYYLSASDAVEAGTTRAGSGYRELTFDDTMRIRNGLREAADPYLSDSQSSAASLELSIFPALRVFRAEFPAAIFEALTLRKEQIRRLRDLVSLASSPSWENLQRLADRADEEAELRIDHPPDDLTAPSLRSNETLALAFTRWARMVRCAVEAEATREVPDAHTLGRLLDAHPSRRDGIAASLRHLLQQKGQTRFGITWLPEDLQQKLAMFWERRNAEEAERAERRDRDERDRQATQAARAEATAKMVHASGRPDQIERFDAGLLPAD